MTLSILSKKTKALLLGMGVFPKDESLADIPNVVANLDAFTTALTDEKLVGLNKKDVVQLVDVADNTKIKEELAQAAEKAKDVLIVYLSGYVINRKGNLYLASSSSSRQKIHLNGISFNEIINILEEAGAPVKMLLLDVCFIDSQDEELEGETIVEALKGYQEACNNMLILSASPDLGFEAFLGYTETTIFTQALVQVLQEGVAIEADELSIGHIYDGLAQYLQDQGLKEAPLCIGAEAQASLTFANNIRFASFRDLKEQGDQLFAEGKFKEASERYKAAAVLLPNHEEVTKQRNFIRLLLKGIQAFEQGQYAAAKTALDQAGSIMALPVVKDKMVGIVTAMAEDYYEAEDYEKAKDAYKEVLVWEPQNEVAQERLEACTKELHFQDYMDEADRLFFDNDLSLALEAYDKALSIHKDRKALRRKSECERLLAREGLLRKQLAEELAGEQNKGPVIDEETLRKEMEVALRETLPAELRPQLEAELREELTPVLKEALMKEVREELEKDAANKNEKRAWLKEAKAEFEEDFWTNALLTNQIEVYRFYLQFFPRPKYTEKAKSRIEDLKKQEELKEQEAQAIAKQQLAKPQKDELHAEASPQGQSPQAIIEQLEAAFNGKSTGKTEPSEEEMPAKEAAVEEEKTPAMETPEEVPAQQPVNEEPAMPESKAAEAEEGANEQQEEEERQTLAEAALAALRQAAEEEEQQQAQAQKAKEKEQPAKREYTEEELWEKAASENTLESYRFYVENSKESDHLVDAYYQINKLTKEQEAMGAPSGQNGRGESSGAYTYGVQVSSEVKEEEVEAPEQEAELQDTNEEVLWAKAVAANTVAGFYEYLSNSAVKLHLSEAKDRIAKLKDNARESEAGDWEEALAANTVDALKAYIRKYPLGDYYAKAMFRISELEANA